MKIEDIEDLLVSMGNTEIHLEMIPNDQILPCYFTRG